MLVVCILSGETNECDRPNSSLVARSRRPLRSGDIVDIRSSPLGVRELWNTERESCFNQGVRCVQGPAVESDSNNDEVLFLVQSFILISVFLPASVGQVRIVLSVVSLEDGVATRRSATSVNTWRNQSASSTDVDFDEKPWGPPPPPLTIISFIIEARKSPTSSAPIRAEREQSPEARIASMENADEFLSTMSSNEQRRTMTTKAGKRRAGSKWITIEKSRECVSREVSTSATVSNRLRESSSRNLHLCSSACYACIEHVFSIGNDCGDWLTCKLLGRVNRL